MIIFVSNTQPADWDYVAPTDQAIIWFAAQQRWPLDTAVAFDSFVTNTGIFRPNYFLDTDIMYEMCPRPDKHYPILLIWLSQMSFGTGGQIIDIIRNNKEGSNDTIAIRGYVPSADPYEANTTVVQISSKACGLEPSCTASMIANVAPQCSIYPVDMSYCGSEGLLTDR